MVTRNLTETDAFFFDDEGRSLDKTGLDNALRLLVYCYTLGDFLIAETFCNDVVDLWIKVARTYMTKVLLIACSSHDLISFMFANLPASSGLCRAFLQIYVSRVKKTPYTHRIPLSLPGIPTFYQELTVFSLTALGDTKVSLPWKEDLCKFHDHEDKAEGYSCTKV